MIWIMTLLGLCVSSAALAQDYAIDSYTIDGGGATGLTGGSYSMSGTIGQPDASPTLATAQIELRGGFWPAVGGAPAVPCIADIAAPLGVLNFFDVAAYIALYNSGSPAADLAAPFGSLNFFDVSAFISSYNAGCP